MSRIKEIIINMLLQYVYYLVCIFVYLINLIFKIICNPKIFCLAIDKYNLAVGIGRFNFVTSAWNPKFDLSKATNINIKSLSDKAIQKIIRSILRYDKLIKKDDKFHYKFYDYEKVTNIILKYLSDELAERAILR